MVDGVLAGQPFVFTDGLYREPLEQYTTQIIACMPEPDEARLHALKATVSQAN